MFTIDGYSDFACLVEKELEVRMKIDYFRSRGRGYLLQEIRHTMQPLWRTECRRGKPLFGGSRCVISAYRKSRTFRNGSLLHTWNNGKHLA